LSERHEEDEKTAHHQQDKKSTIDWKDNHHDASIVQIPDLGADAPEGKDEENDPDDDEQRLVPEDIPHFNVSFRHILSNLQKADHVNHVSNQEGESSDGKKGEGDGLQFEEYISQ
jgi:hypothetical protein